MTTITDIVQDAQVRHDANGITATRRFVVRDIGGDPPIRPRNALQERGIPRIGERHPAWPQLQAVDIQLTAVDVKTWEATVTYRVPTAQENARILPVGSVIDRQWFAVTVTEELNEDVNRKPLYHWYFGRPLTPNLSGRRTVRFLEPIVPVFLWKNELARVQRPSVGMRVVVSEDQSIEARMGLSGTINAGFWEGYPAEAWLIGGLDSRWDVDRWLNTYELFYAPASWRFRSVIEYYGAPPSDAVLGNGIAEFDVYKKTNFAALPFGLR